MQIEHRQSVAASLESVATALLAECSLTDAEAARPAADLVTYRSGSRRGEFALRRVSAAVTEVTWRERNRVPLPRRLTHALATRVASPYFRTIASVAQNLDRCAGL